MATDINENGNGGGNNNQSTNSSNDNLNFNNLFNSFSNYNNRNPLNDILDDLLDINSSNCCENTNFAQNVVNNYQLLVILMAWCYWQTTSNSISTLINCVSCCLQDSVSTCNCNSRNNNYRK